MLQSQQKDTLSIIQKCGSRISKEGCHRRTASRVRGVRESTLLRLSTVPTLDVDATLVVRRRSCALVGSLDGFSSSEDSLGGSTKGVMPTASEEAMSTTLRGDANDGRFALSGTSRCVVTSSSTFTSPAKRHQISEAALESMAHAPWRLNIVSVRIVAQNGTGAPPNCTKRSTATGTSSTP